MAAKAHAILSASSSDRWLHCPPSARLCETYEDKGSDYAAEGTDLYENAGESILAWIIEGAKKVIALDYQIPVPDCVTKAIDEYRSQNDWFGHFLDEKCDVDESFKESSSALYQAYRNYSLDCNEYVRSTADFYFALEKAGFDRLTVNRKRYFKGLKIREDTGAEEDFLQ